MPSATEEQRKLMIQWFGSISDEKPSNFLRARGYTEKAGMWKKPTSFHNPSIYEVECLQFLRDEWDYDWEYPLFQPPLSDVCG